MSNPGRTATNFTISSGVTRWGSHSTMRHPKYGGTPSDERSPGTCGQQTRLRHGSTRPRRIPRSGHGDQRGIGLSLNSIGLGLLRGHQLTAAESAFSESLEVFLDLADTHWPPVIRANLAEVIIGLGRSPEAEKLISTALTAFRERGDRGGEGNALRLLSMARRRQGDPEGARAAAEEAVSIAQAHQNPMWEGYWLLELGSAQYLGGNLAGSLASFEQAAALEHRIGDRTREAQAWDGAGQVNAKRGELIAAIDLLTSAVEAFRSHNASWLQATSLTHLALAQETTGDVTQASETARMASEILDDFSDSDAEALKGTLSDLCAGSP